MDFHLLRVYFKAGVVIPFYLSLAIAATVLLPRMLRYNFNLEVLLEDAFVGLILQIPFFSGIIGLCTTTAFLNVYPKVAHHRFYSLLSWMLLPYGCVAWLLGSEVDWTVMHRVASPEMAMTSILVIVCFFHVIGIVISYIDLRGTIVRKILEQKQHGALKDMPKEEYAEEVST